MDDAEALRATLKRFLGSSSTELEMSPKLSAVERALVHQMAAELGYAVDARTQGAR